MRLLSFIYKLFCNPLFSTMTLAQADKLEVVIQTGHNWDVTSVAITPDGITAITGSEDQTAILWDVATGTKRQTLKGHNERVKSVAITPDGKTAITGSSDETAILWDVATGTKRQTLRGHNFGVTSVAITPDGKTAITAGWYDETAILWDVATGTKRQTLKGHTKDVFSVAITADGSKAITGSEDGTSRLWGTNTGKELCSIYSFDSGDDWLVTTREGLFDGSLNATRYLSYRIRGTLEIVPLERFQNKYWTPGLLAKIWKGEQPMPSLNITKSLPPKINLSNVENGQTLRSSKLTITAEAESRNGYPITEFRLLVDGRPYRGQLGVRKIPNPTLEKQTASFDIELEPGRHTIKVLADTEYVKGATREIEVAYLGGSSGPKLDLPSLYVLSIGVSEHSVPSRSLDYAHNDATEIAKSLRAYSSSLYKKIDTKVIINSEATRRGIFKGLQWLREKMGANANSVGIVFFAGHGEKDKFDGTLYFLPHDSEESDFAGTAIEAETLKKQLASIPGRMLLILDACHSGQIGAEKQRGSDLTDQLLRDLTAEENGLAVICSALGHQKSQESREHKHGMFTQALLEAISGKGNGLTGDDAISTTKIDGGVYLSSLTTYVSARVRQMTKGYQNPIHGTPRFLRDFPIAKP